MLNLAYFLEERRARELPTPLARRRSIAGAGARRPRRRAAERGAGARVGGHGGSDEFHSFGEGRVVQPRKEWPADRLSEWEWDGGEVS